LDEVELVIDETAVVAMKSCLSGSITRE